MARVGLEPWPFTSQASTLPAVPAGHSVKWQCSPLLYNTSLLNMYKIMCLYIRCIADRLFRNTDSQQKHTLNDGIFGIAPRRPSKPPLPNPRPNWPDSVFSNSDASDMDVISAVDCFVTAVDTGRVGLTEDDASIAPLALFDGN